MRFENVPAAGRGGGTPVVASGSTGPNRPSPRARSGAEGFPVGSLRRMNRKGMFRPGPARRRRDSVRRRAAPYSPAYGFRLPWRAVTSSAVRALSYTPTSSTDPFQKSVLAPP